MVLNSDQGSAAPTARPRSPWRSLRLRLVAILLAVVVPMALISLVLASQNARQTQAAARTLAIETAKRAAQSQRSDINAAIQIAQELIRLPAGNMPCQPILDVVMVQNPRLKAIAILGDDQTPRCAAGRMGANLPLFGAATEPPSIKPQVMVLPQPDQNDTPLIALLLSAQQSAQINGHVAILLHPVPAEATDLSPSLRLIDMVVIDPSEATHPGILPKAHSLADMDLRQSQAFAATSSTGRAYVYGLAPIAAGERVLLATWDSGPTSTWWHMLSVPVLTTLIVGLLSLGGGFVALHLLISRPLARINAQVSTLTVARDLPLPVDNGSSTTEIDLFVQRVSALTTAYKDQETRHQQLATAQSAMLKDVHHRVRNNLQMIASMVNMQMRMSPDGDTVRNLRKLLQRITNLSEVNRSLDDVQPGGRIDVSARILDMIDAAIEQSRTSRSTFDLTTELQPIRIHSHQALWLSLLAGEAISNALRFVGDADDGRKPWVKITLSQRNQSCMFTIANSCPPASQVGLDQLGNKLIDAFAIKLGAIITRDQTDGDYTLCASFTPGQPKNQPSSY